MRKIVMTLVAFMTITMAFAGNSDAKSFTRQTLTTCM